MIVPDINLLLYAHIDTFSEHAAASRWWTTVVNGNETVGIAPPVAFGFIRLTTHRRVFKAPLSPDQAIGLVESWLSRSHVHLLVAGPRHLEIAFGLLRTLGIAGNLTTDVQIASFAAEHQASLCSNDTDYGRFAGLRWHNPLS